jgi:putative membrane-bound dehydrogenase-like protein
MRRTLALAISVVLTSFTHAQAPKAAQPPSPAEVLKSFKITPGLRVELVACEPQITSPVHIAFDADGRLWVVEMRDYPNGPGPGKKPEGRIKVLEDKDGDGFYETSRIFADDLLYANSLMPWKDGVIVTAAPHIVHLRDPGNTGHATVRDILYEGFAAQNPQLRVSNPVLGPDGWIYCANGLRGGQAVKHGSKDPPIELRGMDFRFDLLGDKAEALTGPGQFGNTMDDWGRRFVCDNRHHLRFIALENRYTKNNPLVPVLTGVDDISILGDGPLGSGGKVYPISKNWTTSSLHEGRFTAACGVHLYRGDLLGKDYLGCAFTCEPTGNLVHQEVLTPKGATFTSKPPKEGVEFLASPIDWFRPVSVTSGPDGALYVVDMCRAVIEHPDFMPPELKNRPDLTWGKDAGRIWRIVPEGHKTKALRPDLAKAGDLQLVKTLSHPDGWHRTTAQRLLLEQRDKMVEPSLRERVLCDALREGTPQAKALAAGVLDRTGQLQDESIRALLCDPNARVREFVAMLAERRWLGDALVGQEFMNLAAKDADSRVRYQAVLALSYGKSGESNRLAVQSALLARFDDPWTRLAVRLALQPGDSVARREGTAQMLVEGLLCAREFKALPAKSRTMILEEFAALAGREVLDPRLFEVAKADADAVSQRALLVGLAQGLVHQKTTLGPFLFRGGISFTKVDMYAWLRQVVDRNGELAADRKAATDERLEAIRLLSYLPGDRAADGLPKLIADDPNHDVRLAAVQALARHGRPDLPKVLLEHWRAYTPSVRREVTDALFRQPNYQLALLKAIETKQVKASDLDALRTRQLLQSKNDQIRGLAERLIKSNVPGDRQEALKKYRAALDLKGDAARGKEIFKKNCAICHKVAGVGVDVGPDIGDTRTKTLDALLVDIVLPNAAIDNNYVQYIATTKSGKTIAGILISETASSLTFKRAEAQTEVVLRSDLDDLQSTGVSLMPEGLERTITIPEMADLLSFLKNWRYLDGAVPTGN